MVRMVRIVKSLGTIRLSRAHLVPNVVEGVAWSDHRGGGYSEVVNVKQIMQ